MVESLWNVETLKESVDQRFADNQKAIDTALLGQEKAVGAAFLASEKAITKAEILTDKRFDAVTETVKQVAEQTSNLLPRAEYNANHKALDDKIEVINLALNKTSGDRNLYVTYNDLDNKLAIVVERMESAMKPVVEYVNQQKGASSSSQVTMGKIYATVGAFAAILGVLIYLASQISK